MSDFKTAISDRQKTPPRAFGQSHSGDPADDLIKPTLAEIEAQLAAEGEPLSLAEEIAEEVDAGETEVNKQFDSAKGDIRIAELQKMSMAELIDEARKDNLAEITG